MSIGRRLSDLLALGVSLLAIGYGAYLLVFGRVVSFMTPEGEVGTFMEPSLAGLIPLGIGLLALWGAVRHRTAALWAAAGLAAVFAAIFLFSLLLQFAILAALLLVAAAVSTIASRGVQGH